MPGIITSSSTRSNTSFCARSRPWAPSAASVTSKPAISRLIEQSRRIEGSSSTISTRRPPCFFTDFSSRDPFCVASAIPDPSSQVTTGRVPAATLFARSAGIPRNRWESTPLTLLDSRTSVSRFSDGLRNGEGPLARALVSSQALERNRTSDTQGRSLLLLSAELRGQIRTEGVEPSWLNLRPVDADSATSSEEPRRGAARSVCQAAGRGGSRLTCSASRRARRRASSWITFAGR